MGISNRDYYREPTGGGSRMFSADPGSMTKRILIVTIIAFVLQLMVAIPTPIWRGNLNYVSPAERLEMLQEAEELDRESQRLGAMQYSSLLETWGSAI
ncbi:MAG: hypothetical protein JWM11_7025, partial [Planctomycetaceae bacterium]|nr:hypothetical protein [Planctomycetaceae bacterium]